MRALGLPGALRRFGLTVETVPGWETRGGDTCDFGGTCGHHTAGSSRGTRPSLGICVNGRTGLPGPLCNTFTDRNGVAIVVASGRANHAGRGNFRGLTGNSQLLGHEAEDEGDGLWTPAQLWAFPRVHAAHLWLIGRDESWYTSHRNYADPPGRKPDPAGLEDDDIRSQIHELLTAAPPTKEEPVLNIGATGPAVAFYQECLKAEALKQEPDRPWGKDVPVDGKFGSHMQNAVDRFQRGYGLPATGSIDGVTASLLTHFAPAWA